MLFITTSQSESVFITIGEKLSTQQTIPDPKPVRYLRGHEEYIWTLAKSGDENLIAGGGSCDDPRIHVWNPHTGKIVFVLKGHTDAVTQVAFDDQNVLYSVSHDRTFSSWSLKPRSKSVTLCQSEDLLMALAISDAGMKVVGGNAKKIREDSGKLFLKTSHEISSLAFSPNSDYLAIGMENGYVAQVTKQALVQQSNKRIHKNDVYALCYSPDNQWLYSGGDDGSLLRTSPHGNRELIERNLGLVRSIVFADPNTMLVGCGKLNAGAVHVYSVPEFKIIYTLKNLFGACDNLVLLSNNRYLVTSQNHLNSNIPGYDCRTPCIWDFDAPNLGRGTTCVWDEMPI